MGGLFFHAIPLFKKVLAKFGIITKNEMRFCFTERLQLIEPLVNSRIKERRIGAGSVAGKYVSLRIAYKHSA